MATKRTHRKKLDTATKARISEGLKRAWKQRKIKEDGYDKEATAARASSLFRHPKLARRDREARRLAEENDIPIEIARTSAVREIGRALHPDENYLASIKSVKHLRAIAHTRLLDLDYAGNQNSLLVKQAASIRGIVRAVLLYLNLAVNTRSEESISLHAIQSMLTGAAGQP